MPKEIKFNIKLTVDGKEQLVTVSSSAKDLGAAMDAAKGKAGQLRSDLMKFSNLGQAFTNATEGFRQIADVMQDFMAANAVQVQAETKLTQAMQNTMDATDAQIKSILALTSAQQKLGVVGDEVQLAGAAELAIHFKTADSLRALIPLMNDLIVKRDGLNASEGTAVNVAMLLGKAMEGQVGALRRAGVFLSEQQEALLKTGTESERVAVLVEALTAKVGGMNAALADTAAGKAKQASNAIGDIKEKIGAAFAVVQPYIVAVGQLGSAILGLGRMGSGIRAIYLAFMSVGGALHYSRNAAIRTSLAYLAFGTNTRRVAAAMNVMANATRSAATAAVAAKVAIRGLMSATIVGAALAALSIVIEKLVGHLDKAKDKAEDVAAAESETGRAYKENAGMIEAHIAKLGSLIEAKKKGKNVSAEEKKILGEMNTTYGETMGYFRDMESWYQALTRNSKAYCDQMVDEVMMRELANDIAAESKARNEELYSYPQELLAGLDPEQVNKKLAAVTARSDQRIAGMRRQMEAIAQRMASRTMPMTGASTAPSSGTGKGSGNTNANPDDDKPKWEAGSIGELNAKLDELNEKYKNANLSLAQRVSLQKQILELQERINAINEHAEADAKGVGTAEGSLSSNWPGLRNIDKIDDITSQSQGLLNWMSQIDAFGPIKIFFESNMEQIKSQAEEVRSNFNLAGNALGDFGGAMSELGKLVEDEGLQVAGIVAQAIAQIALGYAQATAAAGGQLGPWGWAAFAAAGLAQMVAMISAIHSATGYATGGIVGGNSPDGDKLFARVNSGEMILNKRQQNRLWSFINNTQTMGNIRPSANMAGVQGAMLSLEWKLKGKDLVAVLANETRVSSKSGRRTNIKL